MSSIFVGVLFRSVQSGWGVRGRPEADQGTPSRCRNYHDENFRFHIFYGLNLGEGSPKPDRGARLSIPISLNVDVWFNSNKLGGPSISSGIGIGWGLGRSICYCGGWRIFPFDWKRAALSAWRYSPDIMSQLAGGIELARRGVGSQWL